MQAVVVPLTGAFKPWGSAHAAINVAGRAGRARRKLGHAIEVFIAGVGLATSAETFVVGVHIADEAVTVSRALFDAKQRFIVHHAAAIARGGVCG